MNGKGEVQTRIQQVFSSDSRLEIILQEKYYPYEEAFRFWELMYDLMRQDRKKAKVMGSLLTAPPHAGKTTLVREFILAYTENVEFATEEDILYFAIHDRATLKSVIASLGHALKIPDIPKTRKRLADFHTEVLIGKVATKLNKSKQLLIIDEFEKFYEISHENRGEILAGFHSLLNESRIPIILVGIEGVAEILNIQSAKYDWLIGTFSSRFPEFKLPNWEDGQEFVRLLMTIHQDCCLKSETHVESFYKEKETRDLILELTEGVLGKIVLLVKWTARTIIRGGLSEIITPELLKETAKQLESVGWSTKSDT